MIGRRHSHSEHPRAASALVLVLVVIAMLSLGAYTFSELMITEYHAADAYGRQVQSLAWAQSGVEYAAALLTEDGGGWQADLYNNPTLFHIPISQDGGFTIVAPVEDATSTSQSRQNNTAVLRMGLIDESSRININALATLDPAEGLARTMLLALPNMTDEIADAILDWIDADDEPREFGKEVDSYKLVVPRNGPLDSIEELLLVADVTPKLLYGEDTNRNGVLDSNENDAAESLPNDNKDDTLDLGWIEYLTLSSKEGNLQHSADYYREPRINLNQSLLTDLYDQLEERFDADVALFVTAYRMNGPVTPLTTSSSSSTSSSSGTSSSSSSSGTSGSSSSGSSSGSTGSGSSSSGSSSSGSTGTSGSSGLSQQSSSSSTGATGASSTGNAATDSMLNSAANALAGAIGGATGSVTRGGLDLSSGGSTQITSLYQLLGAQVSATINGQATTLDSPWPSDPGSLQKSLPEILDTFSTSDDAEIIGRININEARREVLAAIPNMPEDAPDKIVAARAQRTSSGTTATDRFSTAGWLLIEGIVDQATMVQLDSSITARGEVFRMRVVGHADRGGPLTRIEAVVDGSTVVPKIIQQRNLSRLGTGFRRDDLPKFNAMPTP
ncbi:type II secretion system protein GspK [Planctomicrobium piriforme]|uniref:Type II secretion system (T2SS), protein K n=1 Tax=Planctomicrobium piriforme TaxID=1576369 RepID=A0A1I3IJZ2_9PLAN|nr:type II secretion system protein GspK [Planctomicrobium piriforme]SFI48276.1 Type II secretion system (T2SS), protein K [Planctomicrobium piriforme]